MSAANLGDSRESPTELGRRTAMLHAISYAASRIIGQADWRVGIQELLDRLGEATAVSRVSLFEIHGDADGRLVESCRYDWGEPGLVPMSSDPRMQNIPLQQGGQVDEWTLRRQRGEIVQATIDEVFGETRQIYLDQGTKAFISVPILLTSRLWGFLGFDDNHQKRVWSDIEIEVLRTAGSLIAGAIERAETDERLRVSEERYALAARGANDGLWDWDIEKNSAYFSPRLHEILGLPDGALGWKIENLFGRFIGTEAHRVETFLRRRFVDQKRRFRFETQVETTGGQVRWMVARGMIVYRAERPSRIVGSLRDITDFKAAQESLRESEARVRAILNAAMDAIISTDEQGRVIGYNPAAARMFGLPDGAVIGRAVGDLIVPPRLRGAHIAGLRRYVATGVSKVLGRVVELEGQHADGHAVPIELTLTDVPLPEGRIFTAVIRDITERKRFQQQLAEAERQRSNLARHFSPNMVDEMIRAGGPLETTRTQNATVMFADLVNFTAMSAKLSGADVIALLRHFHRLAEEAVFGNHGTLDKYIGDGLMATFGTPLPGTRDATNAVACARRLVVGMNHWNRERQEARLPRILIGIGLHYGEITLGNVGSEQRFDYTAVGDTVNTASRIEALTRPLKTAVVASNSVIEAVRGEGGDIELVGFGNLGTHAIRGRGEPIELWGLTAELLDAAAGAPA